MRALDPNASARMELEISGVAAHRIQALYPESEFEAIAPLLSQRLSRSDPNRWVDLINYTYRTSGAVIAGLAILKRTDSLQAYPESEGQRDEAAMRETIQEIAELLEPRLSVEVDELLRYRLRRGPEILADACLWAWWSMTYRDVLPRKMQVRADKLMLAVAATFDLG